MPFGEPANFLTTAALLAKFKSLSSPRLGEHWHSHAHELLRLERASDVRAVTALGRHLRDT